MFKAELLKGFKVQFGGIGTFLLHPGGLSEDIIAIELPVLLFVGGGFVALPIVPGGTLVMLPEGGIPVLFPRERGGGWAPVLPEPERTVKGGEQSVPLRLLQIVQVVISMPSSSVLVWQHCN